MVNIESDKIIREKDNVYVITYQDERIIGSETIDIIHHENNLAHNYIVDKLLGAKQGDSILINKEKNIYFYVQAVHNYDLCRKLERKINKSNR